MAKDHEVKVRISGKLDKSFGAAITGAQKGLGLVGNVGMKGVALAGKGIAAAAGAMGAFGAASIKTGSEFESSMSQVAATMLLDKSSEEGARAFQSLEDAAREAGRSTSYSAAEAADALNYLALAGYDAEKAADALPTVMTLAGAGAMELADASDMVTDSMSALGIAATKENIEGFADKLAMTASRSNTSVQQLGEAMITVGGTASGLAGGVTEAAASLGILADSGIKASEGGTHLRNMIMALQKPRNSNAGSIMEQLGINAYDEATGKMKSLGETFGELNQQLAGRSTAETNSILATIFKQTDLASARAMLAATANSVESLSSVMDASLVESGQSLAGLGVDLKTLAKNFDKTTKQGDFTSQMVKQFGMSADNAGVLYSGLQALVGDGATRFEELSGAIAQSNGAAEDMYAIQKDNLQGDIDKMKSAFADLQISFYKDVGGQSRGVVQGVTKSIGNISEAYNSGGLSGAVEQLGSEFANGVTAIAQNAPMVMGAASQVVQSFLTGIQQNLPAIASGAVNTLIAFAQGVIQNAPLLLNTGLQAIIMFAQGIAQNLPMLIPMAVQGVITLAGGFIQAIPQIVNVGFQLVDGLLKGILNALPMIVGAIGEGIMNVFKGVKDFLAGNWAKEGQDIVASVTEGMKTGNMSAANDVFSGMNAATAGSEKGAEFASSFNSGIMAQQGTLQASMDAVMSTESMAVTGNEAGQTFMTGFGERMATSTFDLSASTEPIKTQMGTVGTESGTALSEGIVSGVNTGMAGSQAAVDTSIAGMQTAVTNGVTSTQASVDTGIAGMTASVDAGGQTMQTSVNGTLTGIQAAVNSVDLTSAGSNMMQGLINGMESKRAAITAKAKSIAKAAKDAVNAQLDIHSPSRVMQESGSYAGEGLAVGLESMTGSVKSAAASLAGSVPGEAEKSTGGAIRGALSTLSSLQQNGGTGGSKGETSVVYSPTNHYHFNGSPDKESISEAEGMSMDKFGRMLDDLMRDRGRLAFG